MTVKTDALKTAPRFLKTKPARGLKDGEKAIDRDGGAYGAGIIRGYAVCTRGEALGHDFWIDGEFLDQLVDAINHRKLGKKSRFTHPGWSADGMGKMLGRARDAYRDGDVVRADLHFNESSHKTPDGDLATYTMELAEEDPKSFGSSIVFMHDAAAEMEFESEHTGGDGFVSPDEKNKKNFPHVRLKELYASDVVDDPAANPGGMFHREGTFIDNACKYARYALGLSDEAPELAEFDVDPDRFRAFVTRFLENEGLQIMAKSQDQLNDETQTDETNPGTGEGTQETDPKGETKPADKKKSDEEDESQESGQEEGSSSETEPESSQQSGKTGADFLEAFGDQGGVWFAQGKSFAECQALHTSQLKAENAWLKKTLKQVKGGEVEVPDFNATDEKRDDPKLGKLQQALGPRLGRFAAGIKFKPSSN